MASTRSAASGRKRATRCGRHLCTSSVSARRRPPASLPAPLIPPALIAARVTQQLLYNSPDAVESRRNPGPDAEEDADDFRRLHVAVLAFVNEWFDSEPGEQ